MENWRRVVILIIGFLESLIFSGIIFGWASLLFVLQEEGIYSHLCHIQTAKVTLVEQTDELLVTQTTQDLGDYDDEASERNLYSNMMNVSAGGVAKSQRCALQSNEFTLVYTVAAIMYGMTSVLIGFSLDRFGLWATRLSGSLMLVTGFFCLAFTTKESSWLLWPAMNLVSLGTNQLKLCSYQFTNLWPKRRSTILFVYGSAFSISAAVFTLMQHLYSSGVSYRTLTVGLAIISILTLPVTFLMPIMRVKANEEGSEPASYSSYHDSERESCEQGYGLLPIGPEAGNNFGKHTDAHHPAAESRQDEARKEVQIPLSLSLFSLSAFFHFWWQFVSLFMILFYSISFNSWVYKSTDDSEEVAYYTKIMGIFQLVGPLLTPVSGMFTDWRVKVANRYNDQVEILRMTLQAPAYACAMTTFFLCILVTCKMFVVKPAIYASMVVIAICRPMTHSSCTSFVRLRFPDAHFNRLNGIFTTAVSLVMFVQYPVFVWMFSSEETYSMANWVLIAALLVSLISPAHLMREKVAKRYAVKYLEATGKFHHQKNYGVT